MLAGKKTVNKLAIFGVPRSGTSWLSQIFNSHPDVAMRFQPLFSYSHKGRVSEDSSSEEISEFFDELVSFLAAHSVAARAAMHCITLNAAGPSGKAPSLNGDR